MLDSGYNVLAVIYYPVSRIQHPASIFTNPASTVHPLLRSNILNRKEDHLRPGFFPNDPAGIQAHFLSSDFREIEVHLKIFKKVVLRQNLPQEFSEFRDIPMPFTEFVDQSALSFFFRGLLQIEWVIFGLLGLRSRETKNALLYKPMSIFRWPAGPTSFDI